MEQESHDVLGGKATVFKRTESRYWYCSTYLEGRNHRTSTREEQLRDAIQYAEDWYIRLRGRSSAGVLQKQEDPPKTLREVADLFTKEYTAITEGQRSVRWVQGHEIRLRLHLLPFFGHLPVKEITAGRIDAYRVMRMTPPVEKNPQAKDKRKVSTRLPARKTIHNELVTLRLVLKTAVRHGYLAALPDLSPPYRGRSKVDHRAWFSPAEYKQLYQATRENKKNATQNLKWDAEQLHDYVLFMANTGLRPDEAANLLHRDIEIVDDGDTGEKILVIEVRGKRGVGYCKSMPNAVRPYERLRSRPKPIKTDAGHPALPGPSDPVFPSSHRKMLNTILDDNDLKFDRDGRPRTSYSLRHSYICFRLMEGADIYQIAKNCRTSVEMIEKHYAAHIKTTLDAAAINVRRTKPTGQSSRSLDEDDDA